MRDVEDRVESNLKIASFSPHCLIGTIEAVSRIKYGLPNINRLFFNYSFQYEKYGESISFLPEAGILNVFFSREMPLEENDFRRRLERYYGLVLYYKPFFEFNDLLRNLSSITEASEFVMTEIDLYGVRRHPFFRKRHEGHMMIVTSVSQLAASLDVVDGFFGHHEFSLEDYEACFRDVRTRNRPFHLLAVVRRHDRKETIDKTELLQDLDRTLANLTSDRSDRGLRALTMFLQDLDRFYAVNSKPQERPFLVPGFWAFMCNSMNNARFLTELEKDLTSVPLERIQELRAHMLWLNRRWFVLNLAMESSSRENEFEPMRNIRAGLHQILANEARTLNLIQSLRNVVAKA